MIDLFRMKISKKLVELGTAISPRRKAFRWRYLFDEECPRFLAPHHVHGINMGSYCCGCLLKMVQWPTGEVEGMEPHDFEGWERPEECAVQILRSPEAYKVYCERNKR